ncbi:MAG: hypothetical protein M0Z91_06400 [Actinomycetota bacterium]|jgi:hypothetical protein|nr:hypothetical protein [Actinomycetota bacterium]
MDDGDLKKLIDYAVYAPVGIIHSIAEALPRAVEEGRSVVESRAAAARFIGRMAVGMAETKAQAQLAEVRKQAEGLIDLVLPEPWADLAHMVLGDQREEQASPAAREEDFSPTVPAESAIPKAPRIQVDLAEVEAVIPNYATLSATQITAKMDLLSKRELRLVYEYELGHRGRKTILARAEKLL